jgi:hypothetical protein
MEAAEKAEKEEALRAEEAEKAEALIVLQEQEARIKGIVTATKIKSKQS